MGNEDQERSGIDIVLGISSIILKFTLLFGIPLWYYTQKGGTVTMESTITVALISIAGLVVIELLKLFFYDIKNFKRLTEKLGTKRELSIESAIGVQDGKNSLTNQHKLLARQSDVMKVLINVDTLAKTELEEKAQRKKLLEAGVDIDSAARQISAWSEMQNARLNSLERELDALRSENQQLRADNQRLQNELSLARGTRRRESHRGGEAR
jgi:hypothetical protein